MNLDNWFIPFLDFCDSNDSNFVKEDQWQKQGLK